MKRPLLLLPLLVLALSCRHNDRPSDVLPPDRMVDFLTAAYHIESFYAVETQYRYDVLTDHARHSYDSLLAAQHLTRDMVERSLAYYADHLADYQTIQDSVVARLEASAPNMQ